MNKRDLDPIIDRFLAAWTSQEVGRVLDCYTEDLIYCDPNTRGMVEGRDAMGRYLSKLFAAWEMTWSNRSFYELKGDDGAAFLWHATFKRPGRELIVQADGMDLALLRGDKICRNEVYFDRTVLAPLM